TGTALAQQHLRNILAYLDVPTLVQPEAFIQAKEGSFDADGNIGAASHPFLQELDELVRRLGEATCLMRRRCAVAGLRRNRAAGGELAIVAQRTGRRLATSRLPPES